MLENDEWQSCMQLMRVRLADAVGLAVGNECIKDGEWRWLTKSMGSSGMFVVCIVLFTFLAHFWLFAVILVHTTFAACSYVEYFTSNN